MRVHRLQPEIDSAEHSLHSLAAVGAGRLGLKSQLGHILATASTSVSLSGPFSLRAGGQRAQHHAWHTGGPQLVPDPFSLHLPPRASSENGLPQRRSKASTLAPQPALGGNKGEKPGSPGPAASVQRVLVVSSATGSELKVPNPGRKGEKVPCGSGKEVPLLRPKGCESSTSL